MPVKKRGREPSGSRPLHSTTGPECHAQSPALRLRAAYGWNAWCGSSEIVLLHQWAESESPQKLFVNIRGQIGFRVFMHDVRNRQAYASVYRGG